MESVPENPIDMKKKRILVLADWYAPGFKAGGPIRSLVNLCAYLEDSYEIFVLTSDRDLGDESPYPSIDSDRWIRFRGHHVYYASSLGKATLQKIIGEISPSSIYLNSMFSTRFAVLPMLLVGLGMISIPVFLSPRGMLKTSALRQKSYKKQAFIRLARLMGIQRKIFFVATEQKEREEVIRIFGNEARVAIAGNFPFKPDHYVPPPPKENGKLRMVFIGRIHPVKNLDVLLECLLPQTAEIHLTIVATLEDKQYWEYCRKIISKLGKNVSIDVLLNTPHEEIAQHIITNHIFALPTRGENFGHAIFESLAMSRPVLISDQTPWRGLESHGAGWDLPLADRDAFVQKIREVADMGQESLERWCRGAFEHAVHYMTASGLEESYKKLFG